MGENGEFVNYMDTYVILIYETNFYFWMIIKVGRLLSYSGTLQIYRLLIVY